MPCRAVSAAVGRVLKQSASPEKNATLPSLSPELRLVVDLSPCSHEQRWKRRQHAHGPFRACRLGRPLLITHQVPQRCEQKEAARAMVSWCMIAEPAIPHPRICDTLASNVKWIFAGVCEVQ